MEPVITTHALPIGPPAHAVRPGAPRRAAGINGDLSLLVAAAPFVWLLGASLLAYHLIVLLLLFRVAASEMLRGRGLRVPALSWLLLIIAGTLCLSAVINGGGRLDRVAASFYNASFWVLGAFICALGKNRPHWIAGGNAHIGRYAAILLTALTLSAIVLRVTLTEPIALLSPLGAILPRGSLPPLVQDSLDLSLTAGDWLNNQQTVRVVVLAPYPTALAGTALGLMVLAHTWIYPGSRAGILLLLAAVATALTSASRMGIASVVLYAMMLLWLRLPLRAIQKVALAFVLMALAFVGLWVSGIAEAIGQRILDARSDSTLLRFLVYQESIARALGNNPLIGEGVKVRGLTGFIPLGSHSTYIGLFYRGGLVTLAVAFAAGLMIASGALAMRNSGDRWLRSRSHVVIAGVTSFGAFLAIADIDAPQFLCMLFFLIVSITQLDRGAARPAAPMRRTATGAPS